MKKNKENKSETRRSFLKNSALLGAGAIAGSAVLSSCSTNAEAGGEKVKLLTASGELVEVDPSQIKIVRKEKLNELQERGREGLVGHHWTMVIDLSKCKNARKCMEACQGAHDLLPHQHHINVLQMQDTPSTAPYYMPKPCFHCDNPPCTKVCPVNATFKRKDGIVLIDNERCIGCRFCIAACPYSARMFQWFEPEYTEEERNRVYDVELNVPQKKGTITKCLFSADRLRVGKLPYCVSACPNGVYWFGDKMEDSVTNGTSKETRKFSELIKENAGYTYFEDLGTKPQVYYLPPKNRTFEYEPVDKIMKDDHAGEESTHTNAKH
jgi:molybdopterin-containing oxidoreductase family iron-sulfur binding subunit